VAKKGYPNKPGIPEIWDEVKKKVGIVLTPTAIAKLDELARHYGLSKSELIERIARGWIPLGKMQEPSSEPEADSTEPHSALVAQFSVSR